MLKSLEKEEEKDDELDNNYDDGTVDNEETQQKDKGEGRDKKKRKHGKPTYEVQAIKSKRGKGQNVEYLLSWAPSSDGEVYPDSWEPLSSLTFCDQAIELFEKSRPKRSTR